MSNPESDVFDIQKAHSMFPIWSRLARAAMWLSADQDTQSALQFDPNKSTFLLISHHIWYDIFIVTYQFLLASPLPIKSIIVPIAGYLWHAAEKSGDPTYRQLNTISGLSVMPVYREGEELAPPNLQRVKVRTAVSGVSKEDMISGNLHYWRAASAAIRRPGSLLPLSPFGSTIQTEKISPGVGRLIEKNNVNIVWGAAISQLFPRPGFQARLILEEEHLKSDSLVTVANERFSRLERN